MEEFDWIKEIKVDAMVDYPETWSHQKLSRKDARRFNYLTYKYYLSNWGGDLESKRRALLGSINSLHGNTSVLGGDAKEEYEIFVIADKYNMSNKDINRLWDENYNRRQELKKEYSKRPKKEGRDNKGTYVGNGGGNRNSIRYPRKSKSKRTWAMFYKMFPHAAEQDGWDGNTSKRMK